MISGPQEALHPPVNAATSSKGNRLPLYVWLAFLFGMAVCFALDEAVYRLLEPALDRLATWLIAKAVSGVAGAVAFIGCWYLGASRAGDLPRPGQEQEA